MTLEEFIRKYDHNNSVVLLEGKRKVAEPDAQKLFKLGFLLASGTEKMMFRSGNADGADRLFCDGVSAVDKKRLQVITPYTGHRQKTNTAYETIALDEIDLSAEPEVIYQSKNNRKTEKLIDQYMAGERNKVTIKAAYIIRDTIKVIGTKQIGPATAAIFYDDLENPECGGTGHTMKVCKEYNVPLMDQRIWFQWLEECGILNLKID